MLFVHDHLFIVNSGHYYSTGTLDLFFWNTYKSMFKDNHIDIIARGKDSKDFNPIKEVQGINFFLEKKIPFDLKGIFLKVKQCDYLVVRLHSFLGLIAYIAGRKYKKKILVELVNDPETSLWYHGGIIHKLIMPFFVAVLKIVVKNAPYVHYVSQEYLQKKYPTNGSALACADIILAPVEESVLKQRLSNTKSMLTDSVTLGLIGGYNLKYRGHVTLYKAAKILKKKGYNLTLRFLGGGNPGRLKRIAEKMGIKDYVVFDGYFSNRDDINKWIDQTSILVMPTKAETLGRSVIEAMSRGCPVIGSSDTALREIVPNDCLVYSSDYMMIVAIIEKMLREPQYYKEKCINSYNQTKMFYNNILLEKRQRFYGFMRNDNIISR